MSKLKIITPVLFVALLFGIGFGAEFFSRFSQGGYAGLNYRPKFYDFNVVWMPIPKLKYVAPEFQAGIGGASLSFYLPPQLPARVISRPI